MHDILYSDSVLINMMRERNVHPSVQRIAVLSHVANKRKHPTADEIFKDISLEYPSLSRTTVYNSLHALVDAEIIRELDVESGNKHYDLALQPQHIHFVCRNCGKIYDMAMPDDLKIKVPSGFTVCSFDLIYRGICKECSINILK